MRKQYLLFLSLLVSAFLVLGGYAVVTAQQKASTPTTTKRWSDAATWPDKKVPGANAVVTIGRDMDVILDVTPPALHGLTINGKLSFANNKDVELTTEWIMLHGELEIGTEKAPHTRKATITFTNNVEWDHRALEEFSAFRQEAEQKRFRYFLELFNPNVDPGIPSREIGGFRSVGQRGMRRHADGPAVPLRVRRPSRDRSRATASAGRTRRSWRSLS